ncbi:N-methyl-L-tryptophan oxidase [Paenibacillus thalictri]|uniref:N-methyl-L-tryptophan oxidase n=1 Tax=Paenibacillus thalictri TaxID=2527873 RepID=A0A4Q9DJ75_9BACL|nr:N-methyl-L-tryptophan oxidase [Paenibacillus thalictri]TBL73916.1 N-methyl-L-tryptophan oxidase [Paenibacillus thalictri]
MNRSYDVIIVGAGTMGSTAAYFLAKQGIRTLMLDAHLPPHDRGSHHGDTRIIRFAYGDGEMYVPLIRRAYELWRDMSEESGAKLFAQTGVLSFGRPDTNLIKEGIKSASRFGLSYELLAAEEIRKRWPGIGVPDDVVGGWEQGAGVLFSEQCVRTSLEMALASPAAEFKQAAVEAVELHPDGCSVRTSEGLFRADQLIVSAGAWTGKLMSGLSLPLQPLRKTVAWFEAEEALYDQSVFPAFICSDAGQFYYGFPSIGGSGIKVGRHDGGQEIDPDTMNREFGGYPEDRGDVTAFMEKFMPQAARRILAGKVCIYTMTPDEHFIIDHHPEYPHVKLACGFSGHGFKFGSVVGEVLSELVVNGASKLDISPFSLSRFV